MDWSETYEAAGHALNYDQETIAKLSILRAQLEAEVKQLRYAIFDKCHDGKERLVPIHFEWWAKSVAEARGYDGSELECLLRRLATIGDREDVSVASSDES